MNRRAVLLGVTALMCGFERGARAADVDLAVIVHPANPAKVLAREELRLIFQTTVTRWTSTGTLAVPVNLPEDNVLRIGFDAAVLGLDPERVARYWIDRRIRGGERPPRKATSTAAAIRIVSSEPGAIAYVKPEEVVGTVRVVAFVRGGRVVAP